MSQDQEDPELILAFQIAKQRSKIMGFSKADHLRNNELRELLGAITEVSKQPETPVHIAKYLMSAAVQSTTKFATEQLPYEFNEWRKMITSLSLFGLPTDEEREILKQLETELENAIPSFQNILKQYSEEPFKIIPNDLYASVMKAYDKVMEIDDRFYQLKKRIDIRIQDNMRYFCRKMGPVNEKLFKLLIEEP